MLSSVRRSGLAAWIAHDLLLPAGLSLPSFILWKISLLVQRHFVVQTVRRLSITLLSGKIQREIEQRQQRVLSKAPIITIPVMHGLVLHWSLIHIQSGCNGGQTATCDTDIALY